MYVKLVRSRMQAMGYSVLFRACLLVSLAHPLGLAGTFAAFQAVQAAILVYRWARKGRLDFLPCRSLPWLDITDL